MAGFLLYGATGYTGSYVARVARDRGLSPLLAGRTASTLDDVGDELGLETRAFSLGGDAAVGALRDVDVVLNCAGPFSRTAEPLARACLRSGTHYLDLSGEFPQFDTLARLDDDAREAGVVVLPGVGFGVVPTDCLATGLSDALPSATELTLAFRTVGGVSRGTARTLIRDAMSPGAYRREGRLVRTLPAAERRLVDFGDGRRRVVTNPWRGDVVSAWHSTGIPTIRTFTAFPLAVRILMRTTPYLGWLWNADRVQRGIDRVVDRLPAGPSEDAREDGQTHIWGEVRDDAGGRVVDRLHGPEAYHFTALTAVESVRRLGSTSIDPGFQTPSIAFGAAFVDDIDGVSRERVVSAR